MKKRICLLLTLVISIFVGVKSVGAAKELTCIYKNGAFSYGSMLVQDSEGNISFYVLNETEDKLVIDNPGWYDPFESSEEKADLDFTKTNRYDNEKKELTSCPNYFSGFDSIYSDLFYADENPAWSLDYPLLSDRICNCVPGFVSGVKDNQEQIDNTKWIAKCVYTDSTNQYLNLYFNENKYLFDNERKHVLSSTSDFTESELYEYYKYYNYCPYELYEYYTVQSQNVSTSYSVIYYLDKPSGVFNVTIPDCVGCSTFTTHTLRTLQLKPSISEFFQELPSDDPIVIDDCKDLFGEDLVEKLNDIMDWIKIIVPILLIAFGIVDFTKAVFSGSTDDMTKSQKTFFKRILAAVLVFIAPIFINLILSLANQVWSYISPDACIEQNVEQNNN